MVDCFLKGQASTIFHAFFFSFTATSWKDKNNLAKVNCLGVSVCFDECDRGALVFKEVDHHIFYAHFFSSNEPEGQEQLNHGDIICLDERVCFCGCNKDAYHVRSNTKQYIL